jgi:hypothetical protein
MAYDVKDTLSGPTLGQSFREDFAKLKKKLTPTPANGMRLGVEASNQTGSEVKGVDNNQTGNSNTAGATSLQSANPAMYRGEGSVGFVGPEQNPTAGITSDMKTSPTSVSMPDKGLGRVGPSASPLNPAANSYAGLGGSNFVASTENPSGIERINSSFTSTGSNLNKLGDSLPTFNTDQHIKQLQHEVGMKALSQGLPYDYEQLKQVLNKGPTDGGTIGKPGYQSLFGDPKEKEAMIEARKGNTEYAKMLLGIGADKDKLELEKARMVNEGAKLGGQLALGREKNQIDREGNLLQAQTSGLKTNLAINKEQFDQQMAKDHLDLDIRKYGSETANRAARMDIDLGKAYAKVNDSMDPVASHTAISNAALASYSQVFGPKEGALRAAQLDPKAKLLIASLEQKLSQGSPDNHPDVAALKEELIKINPGYNAIFGK